jgi:hypothetical protein
MVHGHGHGHGGKWNSRKKLNFGANKGTRVVVVLSRLCMYMGVLYGHTIHGHYTKWPGDLAADQYTMHDIDIGIVHCESRVSLSLSLSFVQVRKKI